MILPKMFSRNKKEKASDDFTFDTNTTAKKEHKKIFTSEYVIGIINIDKKQIKSFINNEVQDNLDTNDFYYGYIYEDGYLKYVAHKSNNFEVGNISKLSAVLLSEGDYYIHDNAQYFRFKNKDNTIEDIIEYEENFEVESHTDHGLQNIDKITIDKVPDTLVLQWSLHKRTFNITAVLGAVFIASLITNVLYADKYKEVSAKAEMLKKQQAMKQATVTTDSLIDISQPIRRTSTLLENRGNILLATGDNKKITCTIKFNTENDSRTFIKNYGGTYENGKVVYSPALSNSK